MTQPRGPRLWTVPASREQVAAFVRAHHRHHKPATGDVFRLAVVDEAGVVRGVASVGRPVAPASDDGWTLEVNRVAVEEGVFGACSLLYAAARRIAFTLGYRRLVTFTLPSESGASLRGAGWTCEGATESRPGAWQSREGRDAAHPQGPKVRWVCTNPAAFVGEVAWPEVADPQLGLFGAAS